MLKSTMCESSSKIIVTKWLCIKWNINFKKPMDWYSEIYQDNILSEKKEIAEIIFINHNNVKTITIID